MAGLFGNEERVSLAGFVLPQYLDGQIASVPENYRMAGLFGNEERVSLAGFVLPQYLRVTDGRTDGRDYCHKALH